MPVLSLLAALSATPYELLLGAVGFVVAFGLAVLVHELGHFLAAKAFGVRVERFVIGFDKAVFPFMPACIWERTIGETTYGLSIVPLGGYVKMVGPVHPAIQRELDGEPDAAPSSSIAESSLQDQGALYGKPFPAKVIIYGAGVTMNMILAFVLVVILGVRGTWEDKPLPAVVGWLAPDSPVLAAGFMEGDRIQSVNGKPVKDRDEFLNSMIASDDGQVSATLAIVRGNESLDRAMSFNSKDEKVLGAFAGMIKAPAHVGMVSPNGPADKAGMKDGDTIVEIDGVPIHDWAHMVSIVRPQPEKTLKFVVERKGERVPLEVEIWESADEKGIGQAGIQYGNSERELHRVSLGVAVSTAPTVVYYNTVRYVTNLRNLGKKIFNRNVKALHRELSGPVGIAQVTSRAARRGLNDWIGVMVSLNIALAVMNILPLPVLDGGHIVFAAWEAVFRKPLPARIFIRLMEGAVVAFLGFFLLVTFSDVFKFF